MLRLRGKAGRTKMPVPNELDGIISRASGETRVKSSVLLLMGAKSSVLFLMGTKSSVLLVQTAWL
jgi:hypothetical protein